MGGSNSKEKDGTGEVGALSDLEQEEVPIREDFGTYEVGYLGSSSISPPIDTSTVLTSTTHILRHGNKKQKVEAHLTIRGLELLDNKNKKKRAMTIAMTPLKQLAFISLMGKKSNMVAYVHKETDTVFVCHLLRSTKESANFVAAVSEAFKEGKRAQQMERKSKQMAWQDNSRQSSTISLDLGNNNNNSSNNDSETDTDAMVATSSTSTTHQLSQSVGKPNGSQSRKESVSSMSMSMEQAEPVRHKCMYLGHSTVADNCGEEVAMESMKLVSKQNKPVKAWFDVSVDELKILSKKGGDELQSSPLANLTFHTQWKKKNSLSFITQDKEMVTFCHTLKFKDKKACERALVSIGEALVQLSKKERLAGNSSSSQTRAFARHLTNTALAASNKDATAVLGLFEAMYLGEVPLSSKKSQEEVESGVLSLLLTKPSPVSVAISVSGEGVKVVEALTSEVLTSVFIKNITYTTMISDKKILKKDKGNKKNEELFIYVNHDARLQRTTCEVFRVGRRAAQICEAINVGFKVAADLIRKQKNNPFAPVSQKREAIGGPLYIKQIHRRDLVPVCVLGMGQFGEVYLAKQYTMDKEGQKVTISRAAKLLRSAATVNDRTEFLREAEIMLDFDHPNLVTLVGVAVQQRPWLCVLEYMEYGDLKSVMKTAKEKGVRLTFYECLKFLVQICKGMEYLDSLDYIHMDLAARNCLLTEHNHVKIADFGLSQKCKEGKRYFRLNTTLKLPIKWMAVESMTQKIFSTKSDVWAFGVTCWEIFSYGALPFSELKNSEVQVKVREGYRLLRPAPCPKEFFTRVVEACWDIDWQESRPSFTELRKRIVQFAKVEKTRSPALRDVGHAIKVWNEEHQARQDELIMRAREEAQKRRESSNVDGASERKLSKLSEVVEDNEGGEESQQETGKADEATRTTQATTSTDNDDNGTHDDDGVRQQEARRKSEQTTATNKQGRTVLILQDPNDNSNNDGPSIDFSIPPPPSTDPNVPDPQQQEQEQEEKEKEQDVSITPSPRGSEGGKFVVNFMAPGESNDATVDLIDDIADTIGEEADNERSVVVVQSKVKRQSIIGSVPNDGTNSNNDSHSNSNSNRSSSSRGSDEKSNRESKASVAVVGDGKDEKLNGGDVVVSEDDTDSGCMPRDEVKGKVQKASQWDDGPATNDGNVYGRAIC